MNQVYIVTKGSYSDYRIMGAYADEATARAAAAIYNGHEWNDDADVEIFDIKTTVPQAHVVYCARADVRGVGDETRSTGPESWQYSVWGDEAVPEPYIRVTPLFGGMQADIVGHMIHASGPDKEQVLKSVKDRTMMLTAMAMGIA